MWNRVLRTWGLRFTGSGLPGYVSRAGKTGLAEPEKEAPHAGAGRHGRRPRGQWGKHSSGAHTHTHAHARAYWHTLLEISLMQETHFQENVCVQTVIHLLPNLFLSHLCQCVYCVCMCESQCGLDLVNNWQNAQNKQFLICIVEYSKAVWLHNNYS